MESIERRTPVILVVDDDPGDQELIRRSFADGRIESEIHVTSDGEEALDYLFHRGHFDSTSAPRPDLVLLDLNMPKIDGWQVLAEIRGCPTHCALPVVVVTTSQQPEDIARSYAMGANSYITKPAHIDKLNEIAMILGQYWLKTVQLPEWRVING